MLPLCHNYFSVTPINKANKDVVQQSDKKKYALGVFILLLVVVLWIPSSEVTKVSIKPYLLYLFYISICNAVNPFIKLVFFTIHKTSSWSFT